MSKEMGNVQRQSMKSQKSGLLFIELKMKNRLIPSFVFLKIITFQPPNRTLKTNVTIPPQTVFIFFSAGSVITERWRHNLIVLLKYEEMNQIGL